MSPLPTAAGLAYRERGPVDGGEGRVPVLLLHGWPESSHMWAPALDALAAAGFRGIAPDFAGSGASPVQRPATWVSHVAALEAFRRELELDRVALVVHDWGGIIGLRWACDHPGVATALVISDTGFFPDGRWHGLARVMQTPEQGEELMAQLDRERFGQMLSSVSTGMTAAALDAHWAGLATEEGRLGALDLYRSGDFSELTDYEGKLAALGVPTLVLWGEDDPYAPIATARRFVEEIPHAQLDVIPGTGHFVVEDAPLEYADRVVAFLRAATMPA